MRLSISLKVNILNLSIKRTRLAGWTKTTRLPVASKIVTSMAKTSLSQGKIIENEFQAENLENK